MLHDARFPIVPKRWLLALQLGSLLFLQSALAIAQQTAATTTVTADSVAHTVDALVNRYGYVITFEGHRYLFEGDHQDMPRSLRRDLEKHPADAPVPRVRMSKAEPISLATPSASVIEPTAMAAVLERLISQTNRSGKGHYRLERNGDTFDVIPTEVRNSDGNWVAVQPLFDTRITVAPQERSALEMLQATLKAVGEAAHVQVSIFTAPSAMLASFRSVIGAKDEIARNVLARTLSGMSRRLTWRSFYDLESKQYFFIVSVVPDVTAPSTSKSPKAQDVAPAPSAANATQDHASPGSAAASSARPK